MSRRPTLWIVDPSIEVPETEGVEQVRAGWPGEVRLFEPALRANGPRPCDGHDADAFVILGSAVSVYDRHAWLEKLTAWAAPLVRGDVPRPLLGVCFGHQLIGHLAGAEVGFLTENRAKRVGVETTEVLGGRLLPDVDDLRVVVSHREGLERVPDGFVRTCRRPLSAIDGLEHRSRPVFSYQFHPEARQDFLGRAGLDPGLVDDRLVRDSRRVLDGFVRQALA